MKVKSVKDSKLLNISYESENPEFAQIVANTIATAYIEELMAIQLNTSSYAIRWMTQKMEEAKVKLSKSEEALQAFKQEQNIVTIEDRVAIIPEQLTDYAAKVSEAETQRKEQQKVYQQILEMQNSGEDLDSIPALASDKSLQIIRDQLNIAERQLLELSQKYGEKHPVMKKARGELSILKQKKKEEVTNTIHTIKNKYELLKLKEDDLRNGLAKAKKEAIDLNEKFVQYKILKREVETNQALYKALNMRMKEEGATEEKQKVTVWITQTAELPEFPVKPNKILNIMLGIILGFLGGNVLALFLEYLDNTVKEVDELEAITGKTVIGVIPVVNSVNNNIELTSLSKPSSPFAESFKTLRSTLLLTVADAPPKCLLVSSFSPGDGKTTTAVNLSTSISQANYKVLLIDADMRRPRIHKIFKLQNNKGLSSYLAGAADEGIIQRITKKDLNMFSSTAISQLYICPSGPIPPNPSELLVSNRLKEMLEKMRGEFDFIIIDSPPILGATDSMIISKVTEGTIVTCRAGKTTYDMINQGFKSLNDISANILGIVLNGINLKDSKYYSYYGYYKTDSK